MFNEEPRFDSPFDKRFPRSHWFLICGENVGGWKFAVGLAHDWGMQSRIRGYHRKGLGNILQDFQHSCKTCPHFKRKFHLPTRIFQGDILVFRVGIFFVCPDWVNDCHLPKDHGPFSPYFFPLHIFPVSTFPRPNRQVNGSVTSVRSRHMIGHHNDRLVVPFHPKVGDLRVGWQQVF